jgi:hypothetical protein
MNNNCRGGPLWPPVPSFIKRVATAGHPFSCYQVAAVDGKLICLIIFEFWV